MTSIYVIQSFVLANRGSIVSNQFVSNLLMLCTEIGLGVVCIATRYGLDGPRMESRCMRDFPHPSRPALGPTQPPVQWGPCHSRG